MKQVLVSGGKARLEEVPAPMVDRGSVLVRVDHSCISVGTEMAGLKASAVPLWQKALRQPDKVRMVVDIAMNEGLAAARRQVRERSAVELPIGYSAAGVVVEVGEGVEHVLPGDRVACAGAQCAFHAEIICVPKNLVVKVPANVGLDAASSVALGAIALQGVRRAGPTLGETFVVIGLGILGQLSVQFLRANGCRVIGVDVDRRRLALAQRLGMHQGVHPEDADDVLQVSRMTGGLGADGVIITAASPSDEIVSTAFRMCRRKARVVLVGDVGLDLRREDIYAKELDFLVSTSYGPGRYDQRYEEGGVDYPLAYVRWTEARNMEEYLRLLSDGRVDVAALITAVHSLENIEGAYRSLESGSDRPMMVLLAYPGVAEGPQRRVALTTSAGGIARNGVIRVALIGAGGFAKGMHLPNLAALGSQYKLRAVVSRTGHNATLTGKRFHADYCSTDYRQVLDDPDVDAVIIATRHQAHAHLALEALQAGKHVLVEKPLALDEEDLVAIERFYGDCTAPKPVLLTGFNRRFSRHAQRIAEMVRSRTNPMVINYRMNAGYVPLDHWVHGPEGGGRNKGEACHIYDLFGFITGARVTSIQAMALRPATDYYSQADNFIATLAFDDGSIATLTYTALGSGAYPKEKMDLFVDGMVISLDDFRKLEVVGSGDKGFETRVAEKGQLQELEEFAAAIRGERDWPIPLWQQAQATRIGTSVDDFLRSRA